MVYPGFIEQVIIYLSLCIWQSEKLFAREREIFRVDKLQILPLKELHGRNDVHSQSFQPALSRDQSFLGLF